MKKLILCSALALLSFCAKAQVPTYVPNTAGLPTRLDIQTNRTALNLVIDCRKQQNLALQWKFNGDQAGNSNVVLTISQSVDGINYGQTRTWTTASAGTATNLLFTNYVVAGLGFLRIDSESSANDVANITNQTLYYATKISSP